MYRHRKNYKSDKGYRLFRRFRIFRSSDDVDKGEDDTPLDDIPSATTEAASDEKPAVKRQLSFAVSETLGEDVFRRFLATDGVLCFWRNFAYEDHGRPFLRAAHDANMEYVANVLHQQWKIKSPRIVLVVVSNIAPLHEWTNKRQLEHLQAGIIKAANTTEMWIFTPGANIGITKVIGDAVHNELLRRQALLCHKHPNQSGTALPPLTLIGVTREDLIIYGDMLDGRMQRVEIENEGNQPEENKYELNPDHSHFVIVRDSTINKTGINHFLLKLEQYLASSESLHCDIDAATPRRHPDVCSLSANEIPVVSLLIQGGYDCARLILEHLKKQLPVVVVRGSGGLADLLAYAYYEVSERPRGIQDAEFVENSLKRELFNKIAHHFPQLRENNLARNLFRDRIMECVRYSHQNGQVYLTVLNLHSHTCNLENLDEHLLRALFKSQRPDHTSWHAQMQKDLLLTLDWNSPHVAMSEVFLKDPSNKFKIDKDIFEQAITRLNREDFVDLFLRQGFQIHKYLTPKRLRLLFLRCRRQEFFRTVCWEGALGHGLITKFSKTFIDSDLNLLIEMCTGIHNFINSQEMSVNAMGMYTIDPSAAERKSLCILILWAVFTNKPKLAKLLWQHSDQPIHVALIVSMIYEKLQDYVNDTNVKQELYTLSREFSEMATSVLDASYQDSSCRAYDVLSEETSDWSYKTAVDIAANAKNRTFLSHTCCQKWLSNLFLGNIRIRDLTWGVVTFPQWFKVTVDFVNFMRMTLLVIISGGIVLQAVLYPDYPLTLELFRQAFHRAWFSLFLTPIGELEGKDRCNVTKSHHNADYCIVGKYNDYTCPTTGLWPYLFAIQYFIFLKLILLTLLYALFSATASKLEAETDAIWRFQRYQLVVDFTNRLCLPPPLSIFSYLIIAVRFIYRCIMCRLCKSRDEADINVFYDSTKGHRLSEKDYNYWRLLAQEYMRGKKEAENEKHIVKKQMEIMMTITEDVDYQKKVMNKRGLQSQASIHVLARHTPYPGTRVQRYPVPDKYVPWEVMWTDYDPVAYTRPKSDFPGSLHPYVDEDVLLLRATQGIDDSQLPVFQWNCLSSNPAGISIDRTSWIIGDQGTSVVYKLDSEGVPRNIYGRTGLRGRGALCRWGPNHFALVIITRWQKGGGRGLEFVVMRGERRGQLSLPGGFVPGEHKYEAVRILFKGKESSLPMWNSQDDMLDFFKSCAESPQEDEEVPTEVKCEMVKKGYMDDPWNTDQAWREVELWHIHYVGKENLTQNFQAMLSWRLITEDVFIKLPSGQAVLLQDITQKLQPVIF
ncbi:Transient receptor potential cation channel like protein [Argiope bruennichi]|uniref:Transient receptor potential cation channel like protein n=1 Tax=Argiope bruennichi TaxID=94029 RepID=A0A8T0ECZ6_ARGBR|nr:Transient receptor potential cation channel like protein [Argiope bruennichi]